jgi:hypothetical protein
LYAGGAFHNAGTVIAAHIAKWNGVSWSALGLGLNNDASALRFSTTGDLYVSGLFTTIGGMATASHWAMWSNGVWLPGWVGSLISPQVFTVTATRTILAGLFIAATTPGVTHITNAGTARGYPTIAITGPGRLLYLINYTTKQVIYFDITLVASEILTINLSGQNKTITSSFRGDMYPGIIAGTLTNWYLQPGLNHIGCYVDNAAASAVYGYTPRFWGAA